MQTLNGVEISYHRDAVFSAIEKLVGDLSDDLKRRKVNEHEFRHYAGFFSPPVFDLVAWEQITRVDIQNMPRLQAYFGAGLTAARLAYSKHGRRDKEMDRGEPRRTFPEVTAAELAINILPRLENIALCWGLSGDESAETLTHKPLSEGDRYLLTRYYRTPTDL